VAERLTAGAGQTYGVSVVATRGRSRVAVRAARLLAVLAVLLAAVAVALPLVSGLGYLDQLMSSPEVVVAISFSLTGALLAQSEQASRIGWLLLGIGVCSALYTACASYVALVVEGDPATPLPPGEGLALAAAWLTGWAWFPPWLLVSTALPMVVPYGRPLSPRWRIPLWVVAGVLAVGVLAFGVSTGPVGILESTDNPLAVPTLSALLDPVGEVLDVAVPLLILVSVASVLLRVVRADGVERRQVGWFGYGVVAAVVIILVAPSYWINVAVLLVPAGLAVAALRYRLYDLDLLVNRTIVAGVLLGGAAVAYVALVAWVGSLFGTSEGIVPFVAAFVVALAFHPARMRVQRAVDRLFHGRRSDPYALLRDLDRTLREADTPRRALADAVRLVQVGLRLRGVAVRVPMPGVGEVLEASGDPAGPTEQIPLELHGQRVGELVVRTRPGQASLADADLRVVSALAGPLSSAAYALRLSGDLEASHRRLLDAREEERRRLRRDLHDGLGPQLAGVVMGLDVVRSTLSRGETGRAEELAGTVTGQARAAVDDVRRLVSGLRPPVLDDLGLAGGLASLARSIPQIGIDVDLVETRVPDHIELALYRIAQECLQNVVKHAKATSARLTFAVDAGDSGDVARLEIIDDGVGFDTFEHPLGSDEMGGYGLLSMAERAEIVGGRLNIRSRPGSGTAVTATIPLPRA
jgi:two-component system, NarL family, sensor kinase